MGVHGEVAESTRVSDLSVPKFDFQLVVAFYRPLVSVQNLHQLVCTGFLHPINCPLQDDQYNMPKDTLNPCNKSSLHIILPVYCNNILFPQELLCGWVFHSLGVDAVECWTGVNH